MNSVKEEEVNSEGFFRTQPVSHQSLLPNIGCFGFRANDVKPISDQALNLPEKLMQGKRAERYFSEWLKQSDAYELVAENVQIIEDKQTLGEFDFIVKRISDGQLIHIELVYKYYLFDPSAEGTEFEHWIGPNRGDQLDFKLDKLRDHQFPLLYTDAARKRLNELGLNVDEIEQHVLFLANLFVPQQNTVPFHRVNKDATEGNWMRLSEWESLPNEQAQFAIPEKKDWFSRKLEANQWFSKEEAVAKIKAFHERKRSPLVYSKDNKGAQTRDFVVWW